MNTDFKTVDEYIQSFPTDIQTLLKKVRETIKKNAPDAVESIAYEMRADYPGQVQWKSCE
jgi:uncharacterized protein YdhG (YjbR/CyaY superfamily)